MKDKKFEEVFGLHEDHDYQSVFTVNVNEGSFKRDTATTSADGKTQGKEIKTEATEEETQESEIVILKPFFLKITS